MRLPAEKGDPRLMRNMFRIIAPRYDFVTRAFSYGMDHRWKREAVERVSLPDGARVLDLACGTGDFSRIIARRLPGVRAVAVDLTDRMVRLARSHGVQQAVCADAMCLPFPDRCFDAVFVGYGLRNFPRLEPSIREIGRVLRSGGLLVSLDFFLPRRPLRRLYLAGLFLQGAFWGLLLHGRPRVYTYIPDSLRSFVSIDDFSTLLHRTGYHHVNAHRYILGGIGLHWAIKE
jgi:demethylmenaquinone methyltransferase / 2-methoxy-6-polyprenyl-1,4-benzoquinol methylase